MQTYTIMRYEERTGIVDGRAVGTYTEKHVADRIRLALRDGISAEARSQVTRDIRYTVETNQG